MATKKMAVKKMVAKKPAAAMKKASPMKQKPRVDDAEMKAYIKSQGAAKDKQVATHKQGLLDADKKGYTNDRINLYKNIAGLGEWAMGGAKVNFRTGESKITDFDKKYRHGSNDNMRDAAFTKGGKGEGTKAGMKGGNSSGFPSQDYLKQSGANKMSDRQFRTQFVNDSIRTQGRKEEHRNHGENILRVAKNYGLQTSQVGANIKAAIKKTPTTKAVVKKKTPLTQTKPGTKTDGDMSKLDKYGRTPQEQKIHQERLSKMTPAGHARIKAAGLETKKKIEQERMSERNKPQERMSERNKPQRPTRTPAKMKKC